MWLRNLSIYGDPLARTIYKATGPNFSPADIEKLAGWTHADYLRQVGVRSVASFWYFIHPNTPLSRFAGEPLPFAAILAVIAPAMVGIIKSFRDPENRHQVPLLTTLILVPVVILPFYFAFISQVFQAQGRYFLPALLPIAVLTIAGWKRLSTQGWIAYIPCTILGLLLLKQLLGGGFAS
jgi:ABC-type microcin C transport system permease subunit YejB